MWQVLSGIYIIVLLLGVVLLWSSLVVAKRADQKAKVRTQHTLE